MKGVRKRLFRDFLLVLELFRNRKTCTANPFAPIGIPYKIIFLLDLGRFEFYESRRLVHVITDVKASFLFFLT